jgi:hypothetical protein
MMVHAWAEWRGFLATTQLGGPLAFVCSMAIGWMLTDRVERWRKARRQR